MREEMNELDLREKEIANNLSVEAMKNLERGDTVDILHFAPELKLEGKSYMFFDPPMPYGRSTRSPGFNLGTILLQDFCHHIVLPLVPYMSMEDLVYGYALGKNLCGVNLDDLLELVSEGRIKVVLVHPPSKYTSRTCWEIIEACQNAGYFPPMVTGRISRFMQLLRFSEKMSEGMGLEEIVQRFPELSEDGCEILLRGASACGEEMRTEEQDVNYFREYLLPPMRKISDLASLLFYLNSFGFFRHGRVSLDLMRRKYVLGAVSLVTYHEYLTVPCMNALLGYRSYGVEDLARMSLVRVRCPEVPEVTSSSPASFSFVIGRMEALFPRNPHDVLKYLREHEDKELHRKLAEFDRLSDEAKIDLAVKVAQEVKEIVNIRNDDIKDFFRGERVISRRALLGKVVPYSRGHLLVFGAHARDGEIKWVPKMLKNFSSLFSSVEERGFDIEGSLEFTASSWPVSKPGHSFILWEESTGGVGV